MPQGGVGEQAAFRDLSATSGVVFEHQNGATGEFHLVEILGSGVALLDYDNDEDLDLFLVQGGPLEGGAGMATDRLYRNHFSGDAAPRFEDVTLEVGLGGLEGLERGHGIGVATADYDRDGWVDLYVTEYGRNRLLRNVEGTFVDVTEQAGASDPRFSTTATFFDFDRDGWLDLFVGNYVDYRLEGAPRCNDMTGAQDYCGPGRFRFESDRLLRNLGDGRFEDVTARAGLARSAGPALGAIAFDYDNNGTLDLYVANDAQPNLLFSNRGDGTFEEVAMLAGAALNREGRAEASMGLVAADYDLDGDDDLFMTHLFRESNTLFENTGGVFRDVSAASGLGSPSLPFTGFGVAWEDFDRDGVLDVLVANGAIARIEELVSSGDPFPFHQRNQLFLSQASRASSGARASWLAEVSPDDEPSLEASQVSRGLAVGDLDQDGDADVVISNNGASPQILVNQSAPETAWLGVRVVDQASGNVDAIGARVGVLRDGSVRSWRRVHTDGSYASARDPRIVFVLPAQDAIDGVSVRVAWPDGSQSDFSGLETGRYQRLERAGGVH